MNGEKIKTINEIKKIKEAFICPVCNAIFDANENKHKFTKQDNIVKMILDPIKEKSQTEGNKLR